MLRVALLVALTTVLSSDPAGAQCCKPAGARCEGPGHAGHGGPQVGGAEDREAPEEAAGDQKSIRPSPAQPGLLAAYFKIWRGLGEDDLRDLDKARKDLVAALGAAIKAPPEKLAARERDRRAMLLEATRREAEKLEIADLKKARAGFGALSDELRKLVKALPQEADAYVVRCDMAKKSWLQDSPKVLNPYYGQSMTDCGRVIRKPAAPGAKEAEKKDAEPRKPPAGEKKGGDPHAGHRH
ncbi:MAG: DUF3347 domain-containing protein [Planctomycetes bacterium]|nr:DUF3347 domain-containing protein [Planctomycetota bacterium]